MTAVQDGEEPLKGSQNRIRGAWDTATTCTAKQESINQDNLAGKMFSQICDTELRLVCHCALLKKQYSVPSFSPDSDTITTRNLVVSHGLCEPHSSPAKHEL